MMNKDSSDHIGYKNMGLFISLCWFHLAIFVLFLMKFVGRHVLRIKTEDSSVPLQSAPEREFNGFGKEKEEEEAEEEPSIFSFKFEHQIPKISAISNKEESFPAKTTSVSNYQFVSEKNVSGFIKEPEAMTFQVVESFIEGDEEKLARDFAQHSMQSKIPIFSETNPLAGQEVSTSSSSFDSDSAADTQKLSARTEGVASLKAEKSEVRSPIVSHVNSLYEKELAESSSGFDSDSSMSLMDPKLEVRGPPFSEVSSLRRDEFIEGFAGLNLDAAEDFEEDVMQSRSEMLLRDQDLNGRRPFSFDASFDSDSDSISLSDGYSVKKLAVDSDSDGFLSERDFGDNEGLIDSITSQKNEGGQQSSNCEDVFNDGFLSERCFSEAGETSESDSLEAELELRELNVGEDDKAQLPSSSGVQLEFMDSSDDELLCSKNDSNDSEHSNSTEPEPVHTECDSSSAQTTQSDEVVGRNTDECEEKTGEEKSAETQMKDLDDEEMDELESLWEHQDLIEQLKMELKRVRAIGLPTIFEESESPRTIEDLKPFKIEEKFLREDPLDELHKFYKSYRERMRKFDILNYQKMYAIGFLQLKDPLGSLGAQKPLMSTILSHFSQNLKPLCRRKSMTDPSEKFMKELQVDLETIYVGQTCLSWEFLRWQYEKARELPDSDPYRSHQYNQVAGEFQQFQVLLERFIENESFQGPRLQNYVKNRCVLRNLLQVPVIKEDCLKDKMEEKRKGNYAITSEMLEDIMEESIRIFWEFVRADKDETSIILKGLIGNQVELQDPSDFELMSEIQASLQKKEKKLKDILKIGNCLVKKFKKPREDRSNQDVFFSQVDMKLVSRVLKMSRITTDQLVWCHKKLSKITFLDRKIHREPSFLLFPC